MTDAAPPPVDTQQIATPEQVRAAVLAEAEANLVASLANAVTAIYGISGSGKSSLADTAAEYNWEVHGATTLCYAIDPGGFGTKRLALVKAGIMRVWRPTNHTNFFETMELASMGAWPEHVTNPETGYADPNVRLVLPRAFRYTLIGPCGHATRSWTNEMMLNAEGAVPAACPECGTMCGLGNALRIDRALVRNRLFKNVGLRIYDSLSAQSDQGLILELPSMSASGSLPVGKSGGSALGSADALRSGSVSYGTGSEAQVGFMQNRAYGWLMNINKIPDQKTPPVCIFGVEQSKADDDTSGMVVLGPRIAGRARTGAVPGWVGNCVHAVQEQDAAGQMRFRLYLRTHVDPRDPRKIPYLAKHRGVPRGIPEFLEDPWDADPLKREELAWTGCSLNRLFRMIDAQVMTEVAALRAKYPNAPAFVAHAGDVDESGEEVVEQLPDRPRSSVPGAMPVPLGIPSATGVAGGVAGAPHATGVAGTPVAAPMVAGGPVATRRGRGPVTPGMAPPLAVTPPVPQVATLPVPAPTVVQPSAAGVAPPVVTGTAGPSQSAPPTAVPLASPVATPSTPPAGTSSLTPGGQVVPVVGAGVPGTVPSAAPPVGTVTPAAPPDPNAGAIKGPIATRRPRPPVS